MKNILVFGFLIFSLGGCTSITTMTPAQFDQLATNQLSYVGQWSGNAGEANSTLKLNRQGSGQLCLDNYKELMLYKVKLVNNELYSDQGVKFKVKALTQQQAILHISLLGVGATFTLNQDDQLQQASLGCKQRMTP